MNKIVQRVGVNTAELVENIETITDFDYDFITPLHRFKDATHYYNDMCANPNKLPNLRIPMLALHAIDDPILHVNTIPTHNASDGMLTDKLVCLLTKSGGHVGWLVGLFPWVNRWLFQNTIIFEFFEAICSVSDDMIESRKSR